MREILSNLKEEGCNIEKALERFFYDEELYIQCYGKLFESEEFALLQKRIAAKEKEASLKSTHSLKGVLANLELTPMRSVVLEMETAIKTDSWQEAAIQCEDLIKMKTFYRNILQES